MPTKQEIIARATGVDRGEMHVGNAERRHPSSPARRARAYGLGREAARRMPLSVRERKIARYLAETEAPDQARAYWLGVMREARS